MAKFKLSVITDEITNDFGHALEVASKEFRLSFVEIRELWGKNVMALDAKQIGEARQLLERYRLRVSAIASPIFKVDWPGAPTSKYSPKRDQFGASFTFDQQDELLERGFELARAFNTTNIRIFDFWRLDDQTPYRAAIDKKLIEAAAKAEQTRHHADSGKRARLQYRDRRGSRANVESRQVAELQAQLGCRKCSRARRDSVPRRLRALAQRSHRLYALQRYNSQTRRHD